MVYVKYFSVVRVKMMREGIRLIIIHTQGTKIISRIYSWLTETFDKFIKFIEIEI